MSWTDKDSTLPRRTWGFLILISSSKESTGERVRETYLNPNLCMSASNCGSRATRGKIRMAVFPSSDKILVSIFFSSDLRWKISHPLQRCWPPFEETTFHHQLGCSKPYVCRSRSTWWRPPVNTELWRKYMIRLKKYKLLSTKQIQQWDSWPAHNLSCLSVKVGSKKQFLFA